MGQLTASIDEIAAASKEVSKIIKAIDEIALQTNLLALNAAVEATRAGDEVGAGTGLVQKANDAFSRVAENAMNPKTKRRT